MKTIVHLKETSQEIVHEDAENAYTKGRLYCVYMKDGIVYKYPLANIWRVKETYK